MRVESLIIKIMKILKSIILIFFILILMGNCKGDFISSQITTPSPRPTVAIVFEKKTIAVKNIPLIVEIADTPEKRQVGLMYRESLDENQGMLFIFPRPDMYSFWMKNTLIPLSIAFIEEDGIIKQIEDMEPGIETSHTSDFHVKYALEVNKGWFNKNHIKTGDKVDLD
ncbi:MAG: hypothetical protein BWY64_02284 [bacterium ADurb.Bin363]|nr:MAG: hypothetical protein BWY64_02284 [bacterium ADurb.Bin363]